MDYLFRKGFSAILPYSGLLGDGFGMERIED